MYTRRRVEWTHADVCSSVKQVILHFSNVLTGCWVHLFSPIFCLPKFALCGLSRCFRRCVSFHFCFLKFFSFGQAKGASRSVATPTNQSFRVCKVNLATLKVATTETHGKDAMVKLRSRPSLRKIARFRKKPVDCRKSVYPPSSQ